MILRTASFRPRVQTRKGSLAGFGIIGNGFVLAILPFFLIAFFVVAPPLLVVAALSGGARFKPAAPTGTGALTSGQEAG